MNKVRAKMSISSALIFGSIFWRMGFLQTAIQDRMGLLQVLLRYLHCLNVKMFVWWKLKTLISPLSLTLSLTYACGSRKFIRWVECCHRWLQSTQQWQHLPRQWMFFQKRNKLLIVNEAKEAINWVPICCRNWLQKFQLVHHFLWFSGQYYTRWQGLTSLLSGMSINKLCYCKWKSISRCNSRTHLHYHFQVT